MEKLPQQPGIHYVSGAADVGTFTLSIPKEIETKSDLPMVISLHYAGSGIRYYGAGLLGDVVEPALRDLGAIMVAPDCQAGVWNNKKSEDQIMTLLELILSSYNIDPARLLITGYSIGGIGTWYIAGRHQERFSIAIPMAAKAPASVLNLDWRIPLFVLHGRHDELFPLSDTLETVGLLQKANVSVEMSVVEEATHYETGRFFRPLRLFVPSITSIWSDRES